MAIQILAADGTTLLKVDPSTGAGRVSIRPPEVLGWNSIGGISGALTGVAANGPVFAFRNIGSNPLMVRRLQVGFYTTTAFTTAQALAYAAFVARSWSASDTGGTAIALTGSNGKHKIGLATMAVAPDVRIAAAAALTAGTRALDANPLGYACGSATAVGTSMPMSSIISHDTGDYPVIIGQNEGLVIQNVLAMGAAGVIALMVNIELAETLAFP
jgi:hypothetical protein